MAERGGVGLFPDPRPRRGPQAEGQAEFGRIPLSAHRAGRGLRWRLDGTYAGLKASVADWLNRADLAAVVPDFIALAEGQMNRRLRVRRMVAAATAQVSAEYETCRAISPARWR